MTVEGTRVKKWITWMSLFYLFLCLNGPWNLRSSFGSAPSEVKPLVKGAGVSNTLLQYYLCWILLVKSWEPLNKIAAPPRGWNEVFHLNPLFRKYRTLIIDYYHYNLTIISSTLKHIKYIWMWFRLFYYKLFKF